MMRRMWRDISGATILEFALVAPVLIVIMTGIFNLGYALYCGNAVRSAVERSSRALIADPATSAASLKTKALDAMTAVPIENFSVTVTTETINADVQMKRVTWTYDFLLAIPLLTDKPMAMGSSLLVPVAS